MQLIGKTTNIDFLGRRRMALIVSLVLIAVSIGSLAKFGLNFGVDFTGGVLLEAGYPDSADLGAIRSALADAGFGDASVQNFGSAREVAIRMMPRDDIDGETIGDQVLGILQAEVPGVELRRVEFVGPQVGEELANDGGTAMIVAMLMILAYVAFRFQWKFAVGAVAALVHDVILTVGVFSIFRFDFDLSVLAAILAVIGYSLNDTIVVFDRIRENFLHMRKSSSMQVMNTSLNQMLARTIITGLTTLLVLLALFFLGGEAVSSFALALIIGIVVGTYSSIYIASATALALDVTSEDLMPTTQDDNSADALP